MDPSKKRKNEGSSETDLILAKKQKTNEIVAHKESVDSSEIVKVFIAAIIHIIYIILNILII